MIHSEMTSAPQNILWTALY